MTALPEFLLETYFDRWEFTSRHHLSASDPQSLTIGELLDLSPDVDLDALGRLPLDYVETAGTPALRAAVAATYQHCEPDDVLCLTGSSEGLFWALRELVGPGEHAVVTVPNYQSTESVPLSAGAEVTGVLLDEHDGWRLDLDAVRQALRPDTRLVVVNFPNNPTGAIPDEATFRALVALCEERGIRLLSDEVFRGLEGDPARRLPQAADLSPTALSLNDLSKSYGLPGLRIGWIACRDRELLARLQRNRHYTTLCNAGPSELLATVALRAGDRIHARNRAIIDANLPVFDDFFARHAELFDWYHPDGGCIAFPRYRGAEGVEAFCERAVRQHGVVLVPAPIFGSALAAVPADRFRIGVGRHSPEPALAALEDCLRQS